MASEKVSQVMEVLQGMTLLEFNELKETFKETFGVTAAVAVGPATGGGGAAADAAPAVEEKTEFQVFLKDAGAQKIQVIKAVREVVPALGLKEAKDLVEAAPTNVGEPFGTEDEAKKAVEKLAAAGAIAEVK